MSVARRTVSGRLARVAFGVLLALGSAAESRAQDPPDRSTPQPDRSQGLLPEPRFMTTIAEMIGGRAGALHRPGDGFYPRIGSLEASAGWLRGGPGYRRQFWQNRALFDVSGAVSWRAYKLVEGRVELPEVAGNHLLLGAMGVWEDFTQIGYFGAGPDSPRDNRTAFRLRAADASVYAIAHQNRAFSVGVRGGWLTRPTLSESSGWHNPGFPSTLATFSEATAPGLTEQPRFAHGDVALVVDTRDHPGYPASGMIVRLSASTYHDMDLGRYSFWRYEASAAQHVPLSDTWTLGFREGVVVSQPAAGNRVPFYLYPSLSSDNALRGYIGDRFHDRDLAAVNVESRWAILAHMDGAVFADVGQVAPTLGAMRTSDLRTSYGVGLRFHANGGMLGRIDLARGNEGWRIVGKLSDSLSFPAFVRWATILPIFP